MHAASHTLLLCSPDGAVVRRVTLDPSRAYALGRSPRCDIPVRVASVSRRHALLFCHAGTWRLVDTGSRRGLTVDGSNVRRCELTPGSSVRLGPLQLRLDDGPPPSKNGRAGIHPANDRLGTLPASFWNARTMALPAMGGTEVEVDRPLRQTASGMLLVQSESGEAMLFDLNAVDHATVGYDPLCRISLPAREGFAPLHAILFREPKAWAVVDAGGGVASSDGRFRRRRLAEDVCVELGRYRLRMLVPTVVESRRGDLAPRAVSAFLSSGEITELVADDDV